MKYKIFLTLLFLLNSCTPQSINNSKLTYNATGFAYIFNSEDYQNNIMEMPKRRNVYFMERAFKFKKNWIKKIPGVVHHDNTGRLQTVDRKNNLKFYNLINCFYKKTNIPVVLNTSFNLNGEPIVMTPTDALKTFYSCGLDTLIIGDYVIKKNK